MENTESNENIESIEGIENIENNETNENIENFESIENIESIESIENTEDIENVEKVCSICGSNDSLLQVEDKWICEECLHKGNLELIAPWKDSLETLLKEYSEVCYKCLLSEDPEDVHQARVLGRKIRSVLGFIGISKRHAILTTVRQVHLLLNKVREVDVLLEEMTEPDEGNKVYTEMVKLLTIKQKEMQEQLTENIPVLINEVFYNNVKTFINEELISYILPLIKEKVLWDYEENFNKIVADYNQTAEKKKGGFSDKTIQALHNIRKKSKSLRYIYIYLNEVFGEQYQDREIYYKSIQSQFGVINDLEDWLDNIKAYEKNINVPKGDIKAVKKKIKGKLKKLIANVDLHEDNVITAD